MMPPGRNLAQFLVTERIQLQEGVVLAEQQYFFASLLERFPDIKNIGEIGFHAGFSTVTFLASREDTRVVSFDLMEYDYSALCKAYVHKLFPQRHLVVPGDSTQSVPAWGRANSNVFFDLIFIDGGHAYETACADLENMRAFAHEDTLVVVDDLVPEESWGAGPAVAWHKAIAQGKITELARCETSTRRWGVARYNL